MISPQTPPAVHPSICAGLLAAQAAVQPVEKDKRNAHHGYRYASAEAIITEGRAALAKGGLSLMSPGWTLNIEKATYWDEEAKAERPMERLFVLVSYILCSAEASFSFFNTTPVLPEKGRPVDKATAAALSYDLAYTLRGLLLLPRVDESVEVDARNDTPLQKPAPAAPAKAEQSPAATPTSNAEECRALANQFYKICKSKAKVAELIDSVCHCKSISEAKADTLPALRDALKAAIEGAPANG